MSISAMTPNGLDGTKIWPFQILSFSLPDRRRIDSLEAQTPGELRRQNPCDHADVRKRSRTQDRQHLESELEKEAVRRCGVADTLTRAIQLSAGRGTSLGRGRCSSAALAGDGNIPSANASIRLGLISHSQEQGPRLVLSNRVEMSGGARL